MPLIQTIHLYTSNFLCIFSTHWVIGFVVQICESYTWFLGGKRSDRKRWGKLLLSSANSAEIGNLVFHTSWVGLKWSRLAFYDDFKLSKGNSFVRKDASALFTIYLLLSHNNVVKLKGKIKVPSRCLTEGIPSTMKISCQLFRIWYLTGCKIVLLKELFHLAWTLIFLPFISYMVLFNLQNSNHNYLL